MPKIMPGETSLEKEGEIIDCGKCGHVYFIEKLVGLFWIPCAGKGILGQHILWKFFRILKTMNCLIFKFFAVYISISL